MGIRRDDRSGEADSYRSDSRRQGNYDSSNGERYSTYRSSYSTSGRTSSSADRQREYNRERRQIERSSSASSSSSSSRLHMGSSQDSDRLSTSRQSTNRQSSSRQASSRQTSNRQSVGRSSYSSHNSDRFGSSRQSSDYQSVRRQGSGSSASSRQSVNRDTRSSRGIEARSSRETEVRRESRQSAARQNANQRSLDRQTSSRPSASRQNASRPSASRQSAESRTSNHPSTAHQSSPRLPIRQLAIKQKSTRQSSAMQIGNVASGDTFSSPQPKRRGGKLKIALIAAVVVVLVGAGAAFAYYQNIQNNLHAGLDQEDLSQYLVETDLTKEPFYMLLMGTDGSAEREADESFGGSFRTDSILLVRIDPVNKKAALVSIHRDTQVDIEGYGNQKINAAHAYGGASLAVQTVSNYAGVDISHYAEINFDGFRDIVDALGGVEVDVPVEIDDEDAGGHLDAGLQTLNGEQALILCRSRNTYANSADPDSMRAANQRLVLSAIAKKILSSDVKTIASSVEAISKYVTTDLDVSDIIGLAQAMRGMDTSTDITTAMDPVTSQYIDGGWYTYSNTDEWKAMIERMNQGLSPSEETVVDETTGTVIATNGEDEPGAKKYSTITVKNCSSKESRTEEAQQILSDAGYVNVTAVSANSTLDKTLVIYRSSAYETKANEIVEALGQGSIQLDNDEWLFETDFLVVIGSDWKDAS